MGITTDMKKYLRTHYSSAWLAEAGQADVVALSLTFFMYRKSKRMTTWHDFISDKINLIEQRFEQDGARMVWLMLDNREQVPTTKYDEQDDRAKDTAKKPCKQWIVGSPTFADYTNEEELLEPEWRSFIRADNNWNVVLKRMLDEVVQRIHIPQDCELLICNHPEWTEPGRIFRGGGIPPCDATLLTPALSRVGEDDFLISTLMAEWRRFWTSTNTTNNNNNLAGSIVLDRAPIIHIWGTDGDNAMIQLVTSGLRMSDAMLDRAAYRGATMFVSSVYWRSIEAHTREDADGNLIEVKEYVDINVLFDLVCQSMGSYRQRLCVVHELVYVILLAGCCDYVDKALNLIGDGTIVDNYLNMRRDERVGMLLVPPQRFLTVREWNEMMPVPRSDFDWTVFRFEFNEIEVWKLVRFFYQVKASQTDQEPLMNFAELNEYYERRFDKWRVPDPESIKPSLSQALYALNYYSFAGPIGPVAKLLDPLNYSFEVYVTPGDRPRHVFTKKTHESVALHIINNEPAPAAAASPLVRVKKEKKEPLDVIAAIIGDYDYSTDDEEPYAIKPVQPMITATAPSLTNNHHTNGFSKSPPFRLQDQGEKKDRERDRERQQARTINSKLYHGPGQPPTIVTVDRNRPVVPRREPLSLPSPYQQSFKDERRDFGRGRGREPELSVRGRERTNINNNCGGY